MALWYIHPIRVRVDLGVMMMKGHCPLVKVLEPNIHTQVQFSVIPHDIHWVCVCVWCFSSAEVQLVISTAPSVAYPRPKIYDHDTNTWNRRIRKTFTNVHKHRNPKNTKHLRLCFFGSGTKHFITFLSLRFFDMRRERHNFFLCWLFHLTPPRVAPRRKLLVWPRQAPKINYPRLSPNLNSLFFSNSKILSPLLPGKTSFTFPVSFPIWVFYCDICDCHIRPARAWTTTLNVCT